MFIGARGLGLQKDSTSPVYSDKLLIWVIIIIRLLCLYFDENRSMESMKEHPKKSILVILNLESELC